MIVIDYQNRKPIYEQIVERFELLIVRGILEPDTQIPSVRSLAMELSINPNTIQKAYAVLEQEGFIYAVKGKGNFISDVGEIRRISLNSYKTELKVLVEKGKNIGIREDELMSVIRECYREDRL